MLICSGPFMPSMAQWSSQFSFFLCLPSVELIFCVFRTFFFQSKPDFISSLPSEQFQAWTGFYASRNVLKGVARGASSLSYAAESLFVRYRIKYPDGPVRKDWAMDKLKAIRWAVSEVLDA